MTFHTLPGIGIQGGGTAGDSWTTQGNGNFLALSTLTKLVVSQLGTTLPGSPTQGTIVLLSAAAGSNPTCVAVYDTSAWTYYTPTKGWGAYNTATSTKLIFSGTDWVTDTDTSRLATSGGTGTATVLSGGIISGATIYAQIVSGGIISGSTVLAPIVSGGTVSGGSLLSVNGSGGTATNEIMSGGTIISAIISGGIISGSTISGSSISGATAYALTASGGVTSGGTMIAPLIQSGGSLLGQMIVGAGVTSAHAAFEVYNDTGTAEHFRVNNRYSWIGNTNMHMTNNAWYDGTNFRYDTSDYASDVVIYSFGDLAFRNATSGTSGGTITSFTNSLYFTNATQTLSCANISATSVASPTMSCGALIVGGTAITLPALPTSDPHVAGQLYSTAGAVMISTG
jgi:fibronectin-binding autotransporter adhesin